MESSLIRAIIVTVVIIALGYAVSAWVTLDATIKKILWLVGGAVILIVWLIWLFGILGVSL